MSWSGLSSNQTITRSNLQDAVNTNILTLKSGQSITGTTRCLTKDEVNTLVDIETLSGIKLAIKSDIISLNQFTSTWDTTKTSGGSSTSTQVSLPLVSTGTYDMIVDWGDNSTDHITEWSASTKTHTYSSSGTYQIKISGTCIGWRFNNTGDRNKIISIQKWGNLRLVDAGNYFHGCNNLVLSGVSDVLNLDGITNLSSCFTLAIKIGTINNGNSWITSGVTNMSKMFQLASLFNQDISNWNTSNVTNMDSMFQQANAFNQNIGSWNVSNVTNMTSMFSVANVFNQNIGSWNVSNVTGMSGMFNNAQVFNQDISGWITSAVTTMSSMFQFAGKFNQNIGSWNIGNVTTMTGMFLGATGFNQNIGSWDTSKVTDMSQVFQQNPIFNQDISGWVTSGVTTMASMFLSASTFNQNISGWSTNNVVNMSDMFNAATGFNYNIGNWNTSNVTNMIRTFQNATSFDQDIGNWIITGVTNFTSFMRDKTNANYSTTNYDALLNGWALQSVKSGISINFGTIKRTAASTASRTILTSAPNNWTITDGGI